MREAVNQHDSTNWHRAVKRLSDMNRTKSRRIAFIMADGNRVDDDKTKADGFNNLYCHPTYDPKALPYDVFEVLDFRRIPDAPRAIYPRNDVAAACYVRNPRLVRDALQQREQRALSDHFTEDEIRSTLFTLSDNKNHGIRVHANLLKMAMPGLQATVKTLFDGCLDVEHFSNIFKVTQISPVLKPGKEATQYASYRQITLTEIIRKVLEKILMTRVIRYVFTCDLINERYMAGLRGKAAGHRRLDLDHQRRVFRM